MLKRSALVLALCLGLVCTDKLSAQPRRGTPPPPPTEQKDNASEKKGPADSKAPAQKGPASLEKFVKPDAKIMKGMTTVYNQDNKFFINIYIRPRW